MTIICASRIQRVVVHARGALVSRSVTLPELPEGDVELAIEGLTPLSEPGSLRALMSGGQREVVSVQSALAVPATKAKVGPSVAKLRELEHELQRTQEAMARAEGRAEKLKALALAPRLSVRSQVEPVDARISDALATSRMLSEATAELDARTQTLAKQLRQLELARAAAALADAQTASESRVGEGHPTRSVTLRLTGGGRPDSLELSYVVPAARWWPVYTLRITDAGKHAAFWLEALVGQLSGESWAGVDLALLTADLIYDARLPELPSLRLGRAQKPAKKGYRPAPVGLDRMFVSYDRAFPELPKNENLRPPARHATQLGAGQPPPPPAQAPAPIMPQGRPSYAAPNDAFGPPPTAMPASAPKAKGIMASMAAVPMAVGTAVFRGSGGGKSDDAAPPGETPPPDAPLEPADAWLDFDALRLAAATQTGRGRLSREPEGANAAAGPRSQIEGLSPPLPVRDPAQARGLYDHRYDAAGQADVPSDGQPHRVSVALAEGPCSMRWRTVPRETPEVFREVDLANPLDAPLLAGPIDVYVEGSLLSSTAIEGIDRGGKLTVGLGVEDRIRVARNARVSEDTAGLLGGLTVVSHAVTVELKSSLGREALVEVVDRVPVSDEKGIEVEVVRSSIASEPYKQAERGAPIRGGRLWKVPLAAAGTATLELEYQVTLPSKNELVGGNRRE